MADNLWALREQKKLSVATMASRAGLSIGLIMEYESGQRSIDPRHLSKLARALYVDEADIKLNTDPRPGTGPLERQVRRDEPRSAPAPAIQAAPPKPSDRAPRAPRTPLPPRIPAPPRPSQLAHLQDLLARLGLSQVDLEAEYGSPLAEFDRPTVSMLLGKLQTEFRAGKVVERHRPHLPEAVDQFELKYLTAVQEANASLNLTLFDGSHLTGQLIGFGPYNLTLRQADGVEVTVAKLALVCYTRVPESGGSKEPGA